MKKRTVFTIIFVCVVAAAIAVAAVLLSQKEKQEKETSTKALAYNLIDEAYGNIVKSSGTKLYGTHIDGLFYSLSPVRYFSVQKGELTELKAEKTVSVNPSVAGTQMEFEIPLVFAGETCFGVGIWHSDAGVYNDAFAVVTQVPSAFASSKDYALFIDTSRTDKNADERLYSEIMAFNEGEENSAVYLFDQGNRMTEPSGKLRTDWDCGTLAMLAANGDTVLSFTGRKYNHDESGQQYDLRCTRGGNTSIVAEGVSGAYAAKKGEDYYYLVENEIGWEVYRQSGTEKARIAAYEGVIGKDYIPVGGYMLKQSDNALISLQTGKETVCKSAFKKLYAAAADQKHLVYIGKEENKEGADYKVQKIVLKEQKGGQAKVYYANNIMDENSPLFVCNEGILTQKDAKSVFISYKQLESLQADVVK